MTGVSQPFDASNEAWKEYAACVGKPADWFFPPEGATKSEVHRLVAAAKRTCLICPVREACAQYALDHNIRFGVWGGQAQRTLRNTQRGKPINHGTTGGYQAESKRGIPHCDECRAAIRARMEERRRSRGLPPVQSSRSRHGSNAMFRAGCDCDICTVRRDYYNAKRRDRRIELKQAEIIDNVTPIRREYGT